MSKIEELVRALADEIASQVLEKIKVQKPEHGKKKKGRPRKTVIEPVEQLENNDKQEKQTRKNKFRDNLEDFPEELVTNNRTLGVANPRPRENRIVENVDVECFICGKKENVSPSLATGHSIRKDENVYKCNDCSTSKRRIRH